MKSFCFTLLNGSQAGTNQPKNRNLTNADETTVYSNRIKWRQELETSVNGTYHRRGQLYMVFVPQV
jgi:hypothetical protein